MYSKWVCEKRGVCKARLHTRDNQVIKPTFIDEIHSSHNHGSDPARIDMLKGYNALKQHSLNSEECTKVILSSRIYRKIQSEGLTTQYQTDREFVLKLKVLPSLAFVPEEDVPDCFTILMTDFPDSAFNVAKYFEETYIGKRLPDQSRRVPPFPTRIWNMYQRVLQQLARTTNSVEGWHNAFLVLHVLTQQLVNSSKLYNVNNLYRKHLSRNGRLVRQGFTQERRLSVMNALEP